MPAKQDESLLETLGLPGLLTQEAEAHTAQVEELARLRRALVEAGEENLKLHRRMLATIQGVQQEVERMKRMLQSLATAR